jgi:transposase
MDEAGRVGIHRAVQGNRSGVQESLFDETSPEWVEVNVRKVRRERSRRFGDVWLALELIKKLGLSDFFQSVMPDIHPKIPWATLANVLIVSRFCEPSSELHIAEQFYGKSAMPDLLGIPEEDIYDNRLYRAMDKLVVHKDDLQKHLKERLGELFDIKYDILLYDVTSSYFEGAVSSNPQAQHGYSRDSRPDCKQICIGLVVTKEGIPLGYEVFEGNRHDSTTVETIIEKMESLYGKADRVWIMDRGMASPENLELLAEEGRRYIIGTAKSKLKKFEQQLLRQDWKKVHEGLEVKLCPSPDGDEELFILCRSAARKEKEQAIHNRFIERLEKGLQKVKKSCDSGRVKKATVVERRIGRLLERYNRASALFDVNVKEHDGKIDLTWTIHNTYSDSRPPQRGVLPPSHEYQGLDSGGSLETVHPTHASRSRLPDPQTRLRPQASLASEGRSRSGSHLGLLPCLRALEMSGTDSQTRWPRQRTKNDPRRDQESHPRRCCPYDAHRRRDQAPLCLQT